MLITKFITFSICLLSFDFTHGAKSALIRTKSNDANSARIKTFARLLSDNDVQSAFRELLGFDNKNGSMSLSMSMSHTGPLPLPSGLVVTTPITVPQKVTQAPAKSPSMARTETPATPPVVVAAPTSLINAVTTNTKSTSTVNVGGTEQQKTNGLGGLGGGAIAGIAVAAVALVAVALVALVVSTVVKKRPMPV